MKLAFRLRWFCCLSFLLMGLSGCALWKPETWDLNRLRDERARDIDERLSKDVPIGQNPFGGPSH